MAKCFEACQNKLLQKRGMFDLLGFDFMIDQEMKVSQFDCNITGMIMTQGKIFMRDSRHLLIS